MQHYFVIAPKASIAYGAVHKALKSGLLVRPAACEQCAVTDKPIQAAHYDYAEPLRVRWLCRRCHTLWDRAEPKGGVVKIRRPQPLVERTYLTPSEVAGMLTIGRRQAYEALRVGQLPGVRIGRRWLIPRAALDRLLLGGSVETLP